MTREQVHCHGAASRCCLSTPQASSFALPPSNASGRLGRTLYWLSHHVEQTHNERYPSNKKKTINITFTLEQLWRDFFGRGDNFPIHCDAISKVRFLYGLPTYTSNVILTTNRKQFITLTIMKSLIINCREIPALFFVRTRWPVMIFCKMFVLF